VGVKPFREQSRDRFLLPDEMPRFFQALAAEPNETARDAILLLLFTGARLGNVLGMAWADIDFGRAVWRIPETKGGRPVVIPLTPPAMEVLRRRHETRGESPWVLPGRTGHLTTLRHVWKGFLARAEITDLRIHDLRRTMGSWQAIQGASLLTIGKSLGHTDPSATAIYARLLLDPVRESTTQATTAMLTAAGMLPAPKTEGGDDAVP
jgi:integrase